MKQISSCIGTYMRRKSMAESLWEVVDERDVAKMVATSPIDPVGFEWVATVGDKQDQSTAEFGRISPGFSKDTNDLFHCCTVIPDMFKHFMGEHKIERV
jgi:hypothetical protein